MLLIMNEGAPWAEIIPDHHVRTKSGLHRARPKSTSSPLSRPLAHLGSEPLARSGKPARKLEAVLGFVLRSRCPALHPPTGHNSKLVQPRRRLHVQMQNAPNGWNPLHEITGVNAESCAKHSAFSPNDPQFVHTGEFGSLRQEAKVRCWTSCWGPKLSLNGSNGPE